MRVLAAILLLLAFATAGWAQQGTPAPGCAGRVATDPRGDQRASYFIGAGEPIDLTGAFFRTDRAADGRLVTTANIEVAQVVTQTPTGSQSLSWTMHWRDGDTVRYASATVRDAGEPSFVTGRLEGGVYVSDGGTPGRLFPGPGGVAQITLPEAISKPGARLTAPWAAAQIVSDVAGAGVFEEADLAPDDKQVGGKTYAVAECSGPGGDAPEPEPGEPVPGSDTPSLEYAPPEVTVMTDRAKARFVTRKERLFVRLRSTGPVTKISGALKRGRKTVAKGKLKAMGEKGTVVARLTVGRVRKGRHVFVLRGTDSEGEPVNARGVIKLR